MPAYCTQGGELATTKATSSTAGAATATAATPPKSRPDPRPDPSPQHHTQPSPQKTAKVVRFFLGSVSEEGEEVAWSTDEEEDE